MKKIYLFCICLITAVALAQNQTNKKSAANQVFELTGNITLNSISNANPLFVGNIPPTYFNDINELYLLLQDRGTLRLKNAILNITTQPNNKVMLSFHRLELINSQIYIQSNDITIICNEYKQSNSPVTSFNESESYAADGTPGATNGAAGTAGADGLDSGNVFVYVTDKIIASSGNIDYYLWGQNGGRGGNGNIGATGADGARGRNCSDGGYQCNSGNSAGYPGKNGGKGGDGGDGGNGGDGGKLTFRLHGNTEPYNQYFTFNGPNGIGNEPGTPAPGGVGGKGGKPGSSNCGRICEPYSTRRGANGQQGPFGQLGTPGLNGTAKTLTRGTFNVDALKEFLSQWADSNYHTNSEKEIDVITQSSGISITK